MKVEDIRLGDLFTIWFQREGFSYTYLVVEMKTTEFGFVKIYGFNLNTHGKNVFYRERPEKPIEYNNYPMRVMRDGEVIYDTIPQSAKIT